MSRSRRLFRGELHMAGRYNWADYTGFICHPDHEKDALTEFAECLKQMHWSKMYLKNMLASEKRLELFTSRFEEDAFRKEHRTRVLKQDNIDLLVCPYVDLPESFETWLNESLSTNTRQKIRRFMRKIENSENLRITNSSPETFERDLEVLVDFWKKKWAPRKGARAESLARKYRSILQHGLEEGSLYLPILWQDNTPLGALGSFIDRQKKSLLFFIAGRDESCSNPPPGLVLHAHSVRWAVEQGFKTYDLLRGDEKYKYSFGAGERRIDYLILDSTSVGNPDPLLDGRFLDNVLEQATLYQKSGRLREAEIGYRQILDVSPDHVVVLRRYGRLLYRNGNYQKARQVYQRLVDAEPDNASGWIRLGRSELALQEFRKAEVALRKAIDLESRTSIMSSYYLGRALQGRGMERAAASEYNRVLNLSPRNSRERDRQRKALDLLGQYPRHPGS